MDVTPRLLRLLCELAECQLKVAPGDEEKALRASLAVLFKSSNVNEKKIWEKFVVERVKVGESKETKSLELEKVSLDSREAREKSWNLSDGLELALKHFQLNVNERALEKVFQLNELTEKHRPILVCGPTEFGKSQLIASFVKAKSYVNVNVLYQHLLLDVFSEEELFGQLNEEKNLFEEGLIEKILRENPLDLHLHLDGSNLSYLNRMEHFILHFQQGTLFWEVSLSLLFSSLSP